MANKRIFIADGTTTETALNYKETETSGNRSWRYYYQRCRLVSPHPGSINGFEPAYNYVMMTLVNIYDPGLIVLPTHRLIKNIKSLNINCLIDQIKENFAVDEYDLQSDKRNFPQLLDMLEGKGLGERPGGKPQNKDGHRHVFGLYTGNNRFYLLTLKDDLDLAQMMPAENLPPGRS